MSTLLRWRIKVRGLGIYNKTATYKPAYTYLRHSYSLLRSIIYLSFITYISATKSLLCYVEV